MKDQPLSGVFLSVRLFALIAAAPVFFVLIAIPAPEAQAESDIISSLGENGVDDYQRYLRAPGHKAFVIAPGGVWASKDGAETAEKAILGAKLICRAFSRVDCVPYDVNGRVVFDPRAWSMLWGPFKTRAEAEALPTGIRIGQRFPDLALTSPGGNKTSISNLRGRVAIVHLWGSWCLPCLIEMPDMQNLYDAIKGDPALELVMVQIRESIGQSQRWMKRAGYTIPLYDSGATKRGVTIFNAVDGTIYPESEIVTVFPTTYVLDKSGVVVFILEGPAAGWEPIIPFLMDAAERSGK